MQRILYFCFLLAISVSLWSCSAQKRVQRYSYLFEQANTSTTTTEPVLSPKSNTSPRPASRPPSMSHASSISSKEVSTVIKTAMTYQGTPYRYGGMNSKGIDCSGLICVAYQAVDRQLPHSSETLLRSGEQVPRDQLQPGHLVFFSAKGGRKIDHVGLVSAVHGSHVEFIHATVSAGVRVDRLDEGYWKSRFRQAVAL